MDGGRGLAAPAAGVRLMGSAAATRYRSLNTVLVRMYASRGCRGEYPFVPP